ncbi:putative pectinesterase/pectinesterase inhibitor 51 [Iris pallida]|uniref:Pectinesterase n=1 Tax=Iris pallida TaxID=29817 RepID=A0AAX6H9N7_IRIPA|nr:putative pectinesterase/pectinesterase inhibitor 51 [Iris pallida]
MPTPLPFLFLLFSLSSAAHHHHSHRSRLPPSSAAAAVPGPIQKACAATRYPYVCESSLSSASLPPDPSATDFILASVSVSATNLRTAQSKSQSILDSSLGNNLNRTNAARNCIELLSYSERRLSAASRAVSDGGLADARAWAGAALLYQYDCWSALKYVNGTDQVADAMSFLVTLTNHTSNALSMVAALQRYGGDTSQWAPPQTERDGYWGGGGDDGGYRLGSQIGVPTNLVPDATVCKYGCQHGTVQSAVDAAPEYGLGRFVVYIKEGVYEETVRVPFEKNNVVLLGDGKGKTVITGKLNADMAGVSTYNTATVGVAGDGFMASNLTFSNTAGPDAHQAVAFRSDSDRSVIENVEFLGHQDTLYAHSLRQLYKSCCISGTVDFIFGNSAAVFQDSLILVVTRQLNPEKGETNTVTAHGRTDPAQPTGFVFYNSVINASAEYYTYYKQKPGNHKNYLGRPWKEYSRTVYIDCYLEVIVRPEGWSPWAGDFALSTLFYGEFGSKGPGSNTTGRVPWSSQIPPEHLDVYSVQNFIQLG